MFFIPETDLILSIRKASLPPSLLATRASIITPSSSETQALLHVHGDTDLLSAALYTSPLSTQDRDEGYGPLNSTATPSPTPSPTSATNVM